MTAALDRVSDALVSRGCKPTRGEARCPAHNDTRASLSYKEGDQGGVVLHCHAGCPVESVVGALGLTMRDLMPDLAETVSERPAGIFATCDGAKLSTVWTYRDQAGAVLGHVARYDGPRGKVIRPFFQPDGNGWKPKHAEKPRPLFGLGVLARNPEALVSVVEGEKCATALHRLGSVAVTSPGGADSAKHADWSPLRGRRVRIWPDHDTPGQKYAADVAHLAREAGALAVELVDVSKLDLPAKGDVVDWLKAHPGAKLADLEALPLVEAGVSGNTGAEVGVLLSEVAREAVCWLWRDHVPLEKITVIDGDPGLGKSTLSLDLAARTTTGAAMPDGTLGVLGGVVLLTAEDGLGDTVRPRLEAHGADISRVVALPFVGEGDDRRPPVLPDDLPVIRQAIQRVNAKLLIIDPLMAFLGSKVDSHRDQDIRRVLAALAHLAEKTGCAVVIVRHLNKTSAGNPMYRGGGSIGIIGACRAGWLVAVHPDDENRRVFAPTKANLSRKADAMEFETVETDGVVRIHWLGRSHHSAGDLLHDRHDQDRERPREEAGRFLTELLASGPVSADTVKREAEAAGVSWATVRRAKDDIGVTHHKLPGGCWTWSLRSSPTCSPMSSEQVSKLSTLQVKHGSTQVAQVPESEQVSKLPSCSNGGSEQVDLEPRKVNQNVEGAQVAQNQVCSNIRIEQVD